MESTKIEYQQHHYLTDYVNVSIGKRLIIIGESSMGTLYEPTKVYNQKMAEAIFGSGPLVERAKEIVNQSGRVEMHLMRIESGAFIYAIDVIKSLHFDLLLLDSLEFHEKNKDVIEHYINMAYDKANTGRLIHAFVQTEAFDHVNELYNAIHMIEELTARIGLENYEFGKYLSVVANHLSGDSSAAMYASLVSVLPIGESPVNKTIKAEIKKHLTKDEIRLLRDSGIVCFKKSYHHGTVCCSPTCAVATMGSCHKNIANYRIVQSIINEISEGLSELIGTTINSRTMENSKKLIEYTLNRNIREEVITDFSYEIQIDAFKNFMNVRIDLWPIFTVEKIVTHSQIRILK